MKYKVLRGANQIGGSVVQISTIVNEKEYRLWVDYGSELSVKKEDSTDNQLIERMKNVNTRPNAIFFTHIHGDHIGLLPYVEKGVHIYIGEASREMLVNIQDTLLKIKEQLPKEEGDLLQRERYLLDLEKNAGYIHIYKNKEACKLNEKITFIPLRVDHSVYDAYMLKFIVDKKSIVHTGDYRQHGRMGGTLLADIEAVFNDKACPNNIVISEGTMMSRLGENVMTEEELQMKASEYLKKKKYAFLICSSTNMDSLASFYNAAVGHDDFPERKFYCNKYVYEQLRLFTDKVGIDQNRPEFVFDKVQVKSRFEILKHKSQYDEMLKEGFINLIGTRAYNLDELEQFKSYAKDTILFYSMWHGYLEEKKEYANQDLIKIVNRAKELGFRVVELHTSGHATAETISQVIELLNPTDAIVPIHTERPSGFFRLKMGDELLKKVRFDKRLIDPEIFGKQNIEDVLPELEYVSDKRKKKKVFEIEDDYIKNINLEIFAGNNDDRAYSGKSALSEMFKAGSQLNGFLCLVKKHKDLLDLCFRGNSGKVCQIYYKNHEFFKLSIVDGKTRISFSGSHARYLERTDDILSKITLLEKEFGIVENMKYKEDGSIKESLFSNIGAEGRFDYSAEKLEKLYDIRMEMLESYFDVDKTYDYYKGSLCENDKTDWKLEKVEQQKLMKANSNPYIKDGYYIYDMEFAQAYRNKPLKLLHQVLAGTTKQNKPDSLAIRIENGIPKALVFIELKSTIGAMTGDSGAINHILRMRDYVDNYLNRQFLKNRCMEAYHMIRGYHELGIHGFDSNKPLEWSQEDFENLINHLEIMIVFANNAKGIGNKVSDCEKKIQEIIKNTADNNNCKIINLPKEDFTLVDL